MKKTLLIAVLLAGTALSAEAATSFSSARSFSTFRPSASSVRTITTSPSVVRPVVIQKNVTVQQNVTHVTQGSSGGGFLSNIAASFAGASLSHWLFAPKAPAPQPQVDCRLEQNKTLAVCQTAVTN